MNDQRDLLERVGERFDFPEDSLGRLLRRRERKVRNQRIGSALLAVVVSLLAIAGLLRAFGGSERTGTSPTPSPVPAPVGSDVSFVSVLTGAASPLAESITSKQQAREFSASPDGTHLAFAAKDEGQSYQIFVADIDGSALRQITRGEVEGAQAHFPRWSPDGTKITFERSSPFGVSLIFVVDLGSGRSTQLTSGPGRAWRPSFHPNGTEIVFTKEGDNAADLWIVPATGGPGRMLLSNAASGSISPDGTTIAYYHTGMYTESGDRYMAEYDPLSFADASGNVRNRPQSGGTFPPLLSLDASHLGPMWSPDGTQITYAHDYSLTEPGPVFVRDHVTGERIQVGTGKRPSWLDDDTLIVEGFETVASGTAGKVALIRVPTGQAAPVPQIISMIPGAHHFHASADGSMLTFSGLEKADVESTRRIFVAMMDGTGWFTLTSGTHASDPRWSPDASKIVYVGGVGPNRDLFVVDVRTGVSTRITHGLGDDRPAEPIPPTPSFSADGETILYTAVDGASLSLWTVPATGGASTRLLRDAAYGAYSPDGSLIAFHPTGPSVAPSVWPMDRGLSVADADGKDIRMLESDGHIMAPVTWEETRPMWSPDGLRLVYESMGSVRVLESATGLSIDVMPAGDRWPSWFDDDTLIVENYGGAADPS